MLDFIKSDTFRRLAIAVVLIGGLGAAGAVGYALYATRDLPDSDWLRDYEPPVTSRVHAGDGRLIAEFAREHRVFVPYEAIPDHVIAAFLSAEDRKFFEHGGIDLQGMARGAVRIFQSVLEGDPSLQSGSTITQQVAKNMLLTSDQTIDRKLREIRLAFRIEDALPKERILELYMNEIFLGNRSYGVAAAALNYFNKPLSDLTLSEAALLAALPQRPSAYNPARFPNAALNRRNWVLNRMAANGYISEAEAEAASADLIETVRRFGGDEYVASSYFVETLRRQLLNDIAADIRNDPKRLAEAVDAYGDTERDAVAAAAEAALYNGGLSIRSTLDTDLQLYAQNALRRGLEAYDRTVGWRGAVTRIDVSEGWADALAEVERPAGAGEDWRLARIASIAEERAVLGFADGSAGALPKAELQWSSRAVEGTSTAHPLKVGDVVMVAPTNEDGAWRLKQIPLVEGAFVALDPHTGRVLAMAGGYDFARSQFNRATQARRQPGSLFKPFVYAAALDHGYTPSSLILDAPFIDCEEGQDECYRPQNYAEDFQGLATLRRGLELSRNVMTVRLVNELGPQVVSDYAEAIGVYDDLPPYLSMSLGAGESTLLRMASAYALLANGGKKIEPYIYDRLQNRRGETIRKVDQRACEGCSEAWMEGLAPPVLPDVREQRMNPVTAYQITTMLEGAVRRGTGTGAAVGSTPLAGKTGTTNEFRDAWFVGFSPDLVAGVFVGFDNPQSLGPRRSGGAVAAPIFRDFMEKALKGAPAIPFRIPSGVRLVEVDAETGRLPGPSTGRIIMEAYRPGTEPRLDFQQDNGLGVFGVGSITGAPVLPAGEQTAAGQSEAQPQTLDGVY